MHIKVLFLNLSYSNLFLFLKQRKEKHFKRLTITSTIKFTIFLDKNNIKGFVLNLEFDTSV